ncbi:hypothetical protein KK137_04430 [Croceibacterium sp. LX-88]|uniref:G protein gamma domain-containing protein n=1 Tax=Croceibacterium selenioxidans TaxID=2838833 RepID=A0ABS5W266_9SPHN|nr:hypothetical protein [Croceibacterium selenioxidans]MBT2133576.1 hypothetical protein [Croceibacterium selenioxidans]
MPAKFGKLFDEFHGRLITVASIREAFAAILNELKLQREREAGLEMIRRSRATIRLRRLGEGHWVQDGMMLGAMSSSAPAASMPFRIQRI